MDGNFQIERKNPRWNVDKIHRWKDDFKVPHMMEFNKPGIQTAAKGNQNEAWNVTNPNLLHHRNVLKNNKKKSICYHQPKLTEQQWTNAQRTQIGSKWRLNATTEDFSLLFWNLWFYPHLIFTLTVCVPYGHIHKDTNKMQTKLVLCLMSTSIYTKYLYENFVYLLSKKRYVQLGTHTKFRSVSIVQRLSMGLCHPSMVPAVWIEILKIS